jgi:hypothetical protein
VVLSQAKEAEHAESDIARQQFRGKMRKGKMQKEQSAQFCFQKMPMCFG